LPSLVAVLRTIEPIAVAVSGGIDSLTLATIAHRHVAGAHMFHAVSPAVPSEATARVERLAGQENWTLRIVDAGEFADPDYRRNPLNRCFFCKTNLYGAIAHHTAATIVSGANVDDLGEYRPGLDAAREHGVRHPYLEAGVGKRAVRQLARDIGLGDLSELPAAPCLSSRVETGIAIRPEVLRSIHAAETFIAAAMPVATVRCRVRAGGIVVELDERSLAALNDALETAFRRHIGELFAGLLDEPPLRFAAYRNGSAFLRPTA
jgi:uncharacterized protein